MENEIMEKLSIEKETTSQIETLEVEKDKILVELSEIKVSKERLKKAWWKRWRAGWAMLTASTGKRLQSWLEG